MPFPVPSLEETRQQVASDIEARLQGSNARTRRSTLGVLAFALAGAIQGLHAHIDNRWRNMLPDELADAEGVERWARRYKIWYRNPTAASGVLQVTGAVGTTLEAGTVFQYGAGVLYAVREALTLTAPSGQVLVDAQAAGAAGNLPGGARLTLLSPITGIQSVAQVGVDGLAGGAELESLDSLRSRVHRRMADPPQGGSLADYVTWALESHQSITRAWAVEHEQGNGSVVVRMVCDNEASPIPSAEVVAACSAYIAARRPAGRRSVYTLAPVPVPVAYQIRLVPNSPTVRAAVEAELLDLHRREARPGGTLLVSQIREAVSIAAGETDNTVLQPVDDVAHELGQMPVFGGIAWA